MDDFSDLRLHSRILTSDDSVALISRDGRTSTFGEVRALVRATGGFLDRLSSGPLRIVTVLGDSPAASVALLSICDYATVVPANPALTQFELSRLAREVGANAILCEPGMLAADQASHALGIGLIHLGPGPARHAADYALDVLRAPADHQPIGCETALVLPTSGSTGQPKLVPLRRASLLASAENIARGLELGPGDTAVHMLPVFHIGAVADLLLAPLISGGRVRFAHPPTPGNLKAAILESGATWFQAVPTMLHALLGNATDAELRELGRTLRFIRSVSADLAPAVQEAAEERFGGVPIIQMYGMTETAGQITSNPLPPARRKPGSVGLAAGPEVAILDRYGNPVPEGGVGEVCVRGVTVTDGYENTDAATHFHGKWLRTGDLGHFDMDGYLFLTGREKDMINRGGEKIAPFEIEQALHEHPAVGEAAAFAIPHPTLGDEVGVAIVARPGARVDEAELRRHLAQHVAPFKLPRRVWLLDELPRLASGKIDRMGLKRQADAGRADENSSAPRTQLGKTIAQLWAETLKTDLPGLEDDFFDAGGDSLAAATFVTRVEEVLGVTMPANLLYEAPRLREMEVALQALLPGTSGGRLPPGIHDAVKVATASWPGARRGPTSLIVAHNTAADKAPFFFCAQGRHQFEDLIAGFRGERPVYVMRSLSKLRGPSRRRLKSPGNNRLLARRYAREIAELHPDGPVFLGGFCQGAVIARTVAEELAAVGREVDLLVVIDRQFDTPCPFPAALIWSRTTRHSAAAAFVRPERTLPTCYPAGACSLRLDAAHDDILAGAFAARIAGYIDCLLDDAAPQPGPAGVALAEAASRLAARREAWSARISASAPLLARPGQSIRIRARVANTSPVEWPAFDDPEGGLFLGARWLRLNLKGRRLYVSRIGLAGHAPLRAPLAPGMIAEFDFEVPFPADGVPYMLLLDVVDDGLSWFHDAGSRPWRRVVLPYGRRT